MCLVQGPQRSDAGEARTRGLSVSEFKVIFDLKSDIFCDDFIVFKVMGILWVVRVFWKLTHGPKREDSNKPHINLSIALFVYFVALRPKPTAKVMAGRSVHLTTLFPGQA